MIIRRHHKRLKFRRLKVALFAMTISLFLMPGIAKLESTGDNYFTVTLNGNQVGILSSEKEARDCLLTARKNVNSRSDELTFINKVELSCEGSEVLWGELTDKKDVISAMENVLSGEINDKLVKAYEVKIKSYIVTLPSKDDVIKLLQSSVDKYDESKSFEVSLSEDALRQLPVLIPALNTHEEVAQMEEIENSVATAAGFTLDMMDFFDSIEPEREKDFSEYELGVISVNYGDDVEVVEVYTSAEDIDDVESAISEVTDEQLTNEIYKVVSGDTLSGIALKVDIPMDDLIAMNASLEDQNSLIRPDDELIITVPQPKLAVVRQEELYYEEDYTAETQYVLNDAWYTTDQVVLQQPSDGHRKVVARVTFENEKKISTDIVKEEVTYEAIPKIVEKGTKVPPTYIKPIYGGRLTSNFGPRKRPTKGASSYHKGIDWAVPTGTPVYASCGGTVAKAGWGSGYGYCVYINHPDGRQTRYGHLSKVLVSAGQSVSQGQRIALSGNTGVSTGPHVHFEILIGGSQVNPLKYVSQ